MNYLELAQRLRQECGISGTGPSSTVSQTGEMKRLVDWVSSANQEIEGMYPNWNWMRKEFSFSTNGAGEYTPTAAGITDFRFWFDDTFRIYLSSTGVADEQFLVPWDYQSFRNTYRYSTQVPGRPTVFAFRPRDMAIMLGPVPTDVYVVSGEYQRAPTGLSGDATIPELPVHLHMIIVYKAMEYYALFESAGEVLERARVNFSRLLSQLTAEELDPVELGEPLA